ncbi:hypothetical protein [Massilia genomosp. 1]|uniref:Lipoprotein n=1 Tax=Massilia genomosp. 1 TaxID=2609280 RepID=A0ABX0MSG2_9BURK|nr:hypothetical protein [Massilia genomosp. 1]NHZ65351.1 hypothetical protein [Massilia genomosp. 1]
MSFFKSAALLLSVCLLQACGTVSNRYASSTISPEMMESKERALVLMSAGAPASCISTSTFLIAHHAGSGKTVDPAVSIGVDAYTHSSEFPDHHGLVSAFSLAPGKYYFSPVIANPMVRSIKTPTFIFEAKAGEATYIGELFMLQSCSLREQFAVRDEYQRDVNQAVANNKALGQKVFVKRLMQVGEPIVR